MNDEPRFRHIFRVLVSLFVAIRLTARFIVVRRRQVTQQPHVFAEGESRQRWTEITATAHEGRAGLAARATLILLLITLVPMYLVAPERVQRLALPLPAWLRWLGALLGFASLPALAWTHQALGRAWSSNLELQEQHPLITSGPYHWVRHPMYTVLTVFLTGSALVAANGAIAPPAGATILFMVTRVGNEEAMMITHFGAEYRAYMLHTGRLMPRFPR